MGDISNYVNITISRETQAISRASFGTPGIISEFTEDYTTTTFDRYREYSNLTEMLDDGWDITDKVYIRASKLFSQNPKPAKVVVGRKKPDSEDEESWTTALTEIQKQTNDWYVFTIDPTQLATITFDIDFVTDNSIVATINGVACDPVVFTTDQETTMGLLKTEIESEIPGSEVTIGADPYRTMTIELESGDIVTVSIVTTGGATQPTASVSYSSEDDILEASAWAETQKKIFFITSDDSDIPTNSTTDLFSDLKALNYDRTAMQYHPDLTSDDQFFSEGWIGKMLPKDPGSATWMYKTLSGITAYEITSAQRSYILNKNGNIYIENAGVSMTERGKVASGEYIDVIRGIDWLEATIQETIFSELVNVDKIPYTNEGLGVIEGLLKQALDEGVRQGVINVGYVVTMPLLEDISDQDKIDRTLPDVKFTATLQGAIHKININGTVTV